MIKFFVPGDPKSRQSVTVGKGGKAFFHRSGPAQAWKDRVHAVALQHRPERPLECPVHVELTFQFGRPKKKVGPYKPTRPDLDNLEKPLMDAMNGVIYQDDALVVSKTVQKVYATEPGCFVIIRRVDGGTV